MFLEQTDNMSGLRAVYKGTVSDGPSQLDMIESD